MSYGVTKFFAIGGGIFSICGAYFNWDFFFNSSRAWLFVKLFGREGARVVYALLGIFLIIMGFVL